MRKNNRLSLIKICILSIITSICFVFIGCRGENEEKTWNGDLLVCNETDFVLSVGESRQLYAEGENLIWTSSDENIASVSENGLVTAKTFGEAKITVASGEQVASCTVSIISKSVPVLTINGDKKIFTVGDTYDFFYTLTYEGAVVAGDVKFSTVSENICISENGELSALSPGDATVLVNYGYLDFYDNIEIPVSVIENVTLELNVSSTTLCVVEGSESGLPTSEIVVVDALQYNGVEVDENAVVWESADANIATVSSGEIVAKKAGKTSVFAKYTTANGTMASCEVKVEVQKGVKTLLEQSVVEIDPDEITDVTILPPTDYQEDVADVVGLYDEMGELLSENLTLKSNELARGENEMFMETEKWRYSFSTLLVYVHFSFSPSYTAGTLNGSSSEGAENKNTLTVVAFDGKETLKLTSKVTHSEGQGAYYSGCRLSPNLETDRKGYILFDLYIPATEYSFTPNASFGQTSNYGGRANATVVDGQYNRTWIKFVDEMMLATNMKTDAWNTVCIDLNDPALTNIKLTSDTFFEFGVADTPTENDTLISGTKYAIAPRTAYYTDFRFWLNDYYERQTSLEEIVVNTVVNIDLDSAPFTQSYTMAWVADLPVEQSEMYGVYDANDNLLSHSLTIPTNLLPEGEWSMKIVTRNKKAYVFTTRVSRGWFDLVPAYRAGAINASPSGTAKNTCISTTFDGKEVFEITTRLTRFAEGNTIVSPYYCGVRISLNLTTSLRAYLFFDVYVPTTEYSFTPVLSLGNEKAYSSRKTAWVVGGQFNATWISFVDADMKATELKTGAWNTVRIDMNDEALTNIQLQGDTFIEIGAGDIPDSNDTTTGGTQDNAPLYHIDPRTAYYYNFRYINEKCLNV